MIRMTKTLIGLLCLLCWLPLWGREGVRIEHFTEEDGFSHSIVMNIIQDRTGYIWVASWDGLLRYDGYRFKTYKARPGDTCPLESNRFNDLCEVPDGRILCKSTEKMYCFNPRTEEFTVAEGMSREAFRPYKADSSTLARVKALPDYRNTNARILLVDRQKGVWIASDRGLDRLSPTRERQKPIMYGTEKEEVVRSLYQDSRQRVWMADKNGYIRIVMPREGGLTAYLAPNGRLTPTPVSFNEKVYAIVEDKRGNVWLGCKPGGLYRLTPQGEEGYHVDHFAHQSDERYSLSNDNVYSITEDLHGNLWIGTYGGGVNLATTDTDGRTIFIHSGNLLRDYPPTALYVYSLYAHSGGTLFIGTNNGLYTCDLAPSVEPESMTFNTHRRESKDIKSLSNNWVTDMKPDAQENLYIATYGGGINYLDVKSMNEGRASFTSYTTEEGLASDIIIALTQDYNGDIWCASGTALSRFNPRSKTSTNYMKGSFTDDFSFVESGLLCLDDSTLLAGTTKGTLTLRPGEIRKSDYIPPIAFDCAESINLTPEEKAVTISFAALDYNKSEPIHYAYKIGERNKEWSYTTDSHIHLSNIPAGTTALYVRSTNGDGVWVDNERSITIHRTPYFNERPVAWMLYGGLILLVTGMLLKTVQYIRHLKRELNDIRLTTGETIEYLTTKLQDTLSKKEESQIATPAVEFSNRDDELFREKVENFILQNIDNADLGIEDFTREIGVSRSVLYLQMKRVFGCTPNNYISDTRMAHAKRMMDGGYTNISEVAYSCGYSDPKYFSRCFKKSVGMTPSEYTKKREEERGDKSE